MGTTPRLAHGRVGHQHGFDFGRAQPVAGYVDVVVHTAQNPVIAFLVDACAVAGKVTTGEAIEIALEFFGILKHADHLAGPGVFDDQVAALGGRVLVAVGRHDSGLDAGQGLGDRAGLEMGGVGQGGKHDAAGFGLPPGVHDGQFALADIGVVPHPGFGIHGFAHRTQNTQRGQVIMIGPFHALRMRLRMTVGAVYRMLTRNFSTMCQ